MVTREPCARLLTAPKGSFFLFGPRCAGKTTWLRSTFPTAHVFDLLDEALAAASAKPVQSVSAKRIIARPYQ